MTITQTPSPLLPNIEPVTPDQAEMYLHSQLEGSVIRLRPGTSNLFAFDPDVGPPDRWEDEREAVPDPGLPERRRRELRVLSGLRTELQAWVREWSARNLPPNTRHGQCHERHEACAVAKRFLGWLPYWYAAAEMPFHERGEMASGGGGRG